MHSELHAQLQINTFSPDSLIHHCATFDMLTSTRLSPVVTFQTKEQIPADYYAQHLGFFCKQELKMQEVHVPLTFRVGTMDQCNYLEQKPGYKIY